MDGLLIAAQVVLILLKKLLHKNCYISQNLLKYLYKRFDIYKK